jgi:hypothetical protein
VYQDKPGTLWITTDGPIDCPSSGYASVGWREKSRRRKVDLMPMPPNQVLRVVISGHLNASSHWSVHDDYTMVGGADLAPSEWLAALADLKTAYGLFYGSVKALCQTTSDVDNIDMYWYAGNEEFARVHYQESMATQVGTGAVGGALSQAVVISKKSGLHTKSGRGRSYWPANAALYDFGFQPAKVDAVLGAFQTMVDNLHDGPVGPIAHLDLAVISKTTSTLNLVHALAIDARPDRIEHRERHQVFYKNTVPTSF